MAMLRAMAEPVAIAVLAKAPEPGFAKTRLAPALGEEGAAALQARLIERTVEAARTAALGPVTLWATPHEQHPTFQVLKAILGITLARQPDGDLGERMFAAMQESTPTLVVGTDCPTLMPSHFRQA